MMIDEFRYIPISAIQHYEFCPRQCSLIYMEDIWEENFFTAEGRILHRKAHSKVIETREEGKKYYGVEVYSEKLGLFGQIDALIVTGSGEFFIVEYKRGKPKNIDADRMQLCAQAICLEEMVGKKIEKGSLFYFSIRKREEVSFGPNLREKTFHVIQKIKDLMETGKIPPADYSDKCKRCSIKSRCMPKIKRDSVKKYITIALKKEGL